MDWFDFKGTRSTDLGVRVMEYPPLTLPEERAEFQQVLGRSGELTIKEGDDVYNAIPLSIYCFVEDLTKVNQISTWLRGDGMVVLGNMPTRFYKAHANNQISLSRILRGYEHRTFSAVFRAQPYRYHNPSVALFELTNGQKITNPGNIYSEPIYIIEGTGATDDKIIVTIENVADPANPVVEKEIVLTGLNQSITIDTEFGVAYQTGSNPLIPLTTKVSKDDWPFTFSVGERAIKWTVTGTAAVQHVKMEPRWRDV